MEPFPTLAPQTRNRSLQEVLRRLGRHALVEGIVLAGSSGNAELSDASDYDLILFLNEMPADLRLGVTSIDHRLTDLIFFADTMLEILLEREEPFAANDQAAPLVHWISSGQIVLDRDGRLQQAQNRFRVGKWVEELPDSQHYAIWYKVNYNLLHARRMEQSEDPVYQMALRLRLLYSLYEVWLAYLHLRHIPWQGDKPAIKRLREEDPAFLGLLEDALREEVLPRKVKRYEALAERALAPLGGLWQEGTTALRLQDEGAELREGLRAGLEFWQMLVAESA